jgi:hypothetical protein
MFPRNHSTSAACCPYSQLSRPRSTIWQSDFRQAFGSSPLVQLVGPYKPALSLTVLPCSHETLWLHADGTNPESNSVHSPLRILSFCHPATGSGRPLPSRSISELCCRLLLFRSATSLSTLRSGRRRTARKTWYVAASLGFAAASVSGDWTS